MCYTRKQFCEPGSIGWILPHHTSFRECLQLFFQYWKTLIKSSVAWPVKKKQKKKLVERFWIVSGVKAALLLKWYLCTKVIKIVNFNLHFLPNCSVCAMPGNLASIMWLLVKSQHLKSSLKTNSSRNCVVLGRKTSNVVQITPSN